MLKLRFFIKIYIFASEFANSIFKMLDKTSGIVLGTIPYNDHTQFVHIYTEKFGKVSYKVSVKRTKRSSQQRFMFVPLTVLDLDVQHSDKSELQQIKEATIIQSPLSPTDSNPEKYTQCLFIAELIDKSVREIENSPLLWEYLRNSLEIFSLPGVDNSSFYLLFTAKLCAPLGFGIDTNKYCNGMQFDLYEGEFTDDAITHPYYLNSISTEYLYKLLTCDYGELSTLGLDKNKRNIMLDILLAYLKIHIPEIGEIKSAEIMKEINI